MRGTRAPPFGPGAKRQALLGVMADAMRVASP